MSLPTASLPPGFLSSPQLLETLLDVSLTGVIFFRPVYAPDGRITDLAYVHLNPAARQMLQLPRCPADTFLTLYPSALETGIFSFYRDTFLSGEAGRYDVNYSYDGLDNYFHLSAQRSGEVLVVSFTDTSHQPRTVVEQALRESQARERSARERAETKQRELQQLFEQAPVAISISLGPDLVVEVANPSILELWGKTREQALGKPLFDVLPELRGQGFAGLFAGVMQTGKPVVAREHPATILRHGKPETGYYNFVYQALRDEQDAIAGVITVVTEVTSLVLARQQAEQSRRQVQNLNEELAVANEELKATNEEIQSANEELLLTRHQLEELNAQLEARVSSRTADLQAAQAETDRQRQQLHTLFEQAPVMVAIFRGPEHAIELANPAVCRFWGRTHAEVINKPLVEALPEVAGQGFDQLIGQVLSTGVPHQAEEVSAVIRRDGQLETVYFNHVYQPLYEPDGTISGVVVFAHEITGQVESRRKVEESEEQVRAVIESAPFPIGLYLGPEMRIRFANQAKLDTMGENKAVIGRPYGELLPEPDKEQVLAQLDAVFTTGVPVHANNIRAEVVTGPEKQEFYYNYSLIPLFDPAGKVYGVMNTAVDVTEINRARKKAEDNEHRFRSLIEESPIATCLFAGRDLVIEVANEEMIGLWGKGNAVMGKPLREALPELEGQPFLQILDDVFTSGNTYEAQAAEVLLVKEGIPGVYYFDFTYKPLFNAQGAVYGILDVALDVTEQVLARRNIEASANVAHQLAGELATSNQELRAANEEVRSTNQELSRTNVDLDNFIYTASHDLKAPISNIEALLTALLRTLPPESLSSERTRRITAMMQDSVERFKKTIGNLTEIVKLQKENNQQDTQVDLPEVIREVLLDLAPVIRSSGARVEVDVAHCPVIRFSEKNLRSVVYNLLSNAIKYRSPDRVPRVTISCRQSGAEQVLTVEDNGLGMEPGRMSQLFTMFKRFHDHVEGTGIGLYMVKKIVENAGGKIEAESQVGAGSAFRVYFRP